MLVIFNELGALESFDKEGDLLNQGAVGIVLKAQFKNIKNTDYIASINYTRSDGSKSSKLLMNLDAENENGYIFNFDNEWYFALDGETTFTIFLYDSSEKIIANGQAQFYIAKTDYDSSEPTITTEQYDTLLSTLKQKINYIDIIDSLGSKETAKPLSANMGRELDVRLGKVETGKANASETNERFASAELRLDNLEDGKVDKINNLDDNNPYVLYGAEFNDTETIQKTYPISENAIEGTIARRGLSGELSVGDPILESDATNKKYVNELLNLYVKYSDIDTDFSLTSTNPIQNKVISKQIKDINYTIMVMKEELFETILSEIDYKVDYATIYPIPETLSDDDGTHRVVYSDTQIKEGEGNSVAFNQLVKTTIAEGTNNGITITKDENDNLILNGTCTSTSNYYVSIVNRYGFAKDKLIAGHKYLKTTRQNQLGSYVNGISNTTPSIFNTFDVIFTFESIVENNLTYALIVPPNAVCNNLKVIPQLFDLTLMFGAGNEPTTVEDFNRIFPNAYYPYNVGEIKNTVIKGVKVNGANLCDKITLSGYSYATDYLKYNDNNSMFVKANITFTFYSPTEAFYLQAYSSKNNNAYLLIENALSVVDLNVLNAYCWDGRGLQTIPTVRKLTFTPKVDCYITICGQTKTLETPTLVIGTTALTNYKPYKEPRIINIPQTELPSAGSVHDTIKFVEGNVVAGQQRYNMVHVSRINSVDLGTLDWRYDITNKRFLSSKVDIVLCVYGKNQPAPNMVCPKYETKNTWFLDVSETDKLISTNNTASSPKIYIKDSAYTDPTTFKTAMSGVILNYEKAEYTETTLATDLIFEEVSAIIEQGGSIETIFENVPPNLKTTFVVNKAIVS